MSTPRRIDGADFPFFADPVAPLTVPYLDPLPSSSPVAPRQPTFHSDKAMYFDPFYLVAANPLLELKEEESDGIVSDTELATSAQ